MFKSASDREEAVVIAAGIALVARIIHFGHLEQPDRDIDDAFRLGEKFVAKTEQRAAAAKAAEAGGN